MLLLLLLLLDPSLTRAGLPLIIIKEQLLDSSCKPQAPT